MRIFREELFGPSIAVTPVDGLEEALALAGAGGYGLAASIFTANVGAAVRFAREAKSGNLHINWTPLWRNDLMPYGGFGKSGFGKEGVRRRHRRDDRNKDGDFARMTAAKTLGVGVVGLGLDGSRARARVARGAVAISGDGDFD